jgi:3-(3-hydroxy-phenyl)propionate hydroxylase
MVNAMSADLAGCCVRLHFQPIPRLNMESHDVEVLVVGLGPVGSTGALYLARQGLSVVAVETRDQGSTDLRASTFHAPTIEMLDQLGAADVLLLDGLIAPVYQYRDRQSGEVFSFDMTELADRTAFPYRIQCEQHRLSQAITATLQSEPNVDVRFNRRLLFIEQNDHGVTAWVEGPTAVEKITARYLIAADGASSTTRKLLGLGFPGFTYQEKFLCLSTEYPIEQVLQGLSHINYISDPEEWMVLLRVPGLWRILVPAAADDADADLLSDANKDQIFKRMLGIEMPIQTRHRTIYRVHQRVCERFALGRIGLVGDAAHLNSPMGGYGMNSGIHDVINLGEKIVRILKGGEDPTLIEQFERQRRKVTEDFVQTQTIENTRLMREGWSTARGERRDRMQRLMNDAGARRAFLLRTSMFTSLEEAAAIA